MKNFKESILGTIYLRPSKTIKDSIGYHLHNINGIFSTGLQWQAVSLIFNINQESTRWLSWSIFQTKFLQGFSNHIMGTEVRHQNNPNLDLLSNNYFILKSRFYKRFYNHFPKEHYSEIKILRTIIQHVSWGAYCCTVQSFYSKQQAKEWTHNICLVQSNVQNVLRYLNKNLASLNLANDTIRKSLESQKS